MTVDARRRAERCFALARSTTFEGERSNAIERGTKIANDAGLPLDSFDIPGRAKGPPASRYGEDLFVRPRSPAFTHGGYSREELAETIDRYRETLRRSMNVSDYIFAAERSRRAKESEQHQREICNLAANFLSSKDIRVYPLDSTWSKWHVDGEELTARAMVFAAEIRGFEP